MLVLRRLVGEKIIINGNVVIEVMEQERTGAVRLGITAPRSVSVHREEIHRKIEAGGIDYKKPGGGA